MEGAAYTLEEWWTSRSLKAFDIVDGFSSPERQHPTTLRFKEDDLNDLAGPVHYLSPSLI